MSSRGAGVAANGQPDQHVRGEVEALIPAPLIDRGAGPHEVEKPGDQGLRVGGGEQKESRQVVGPLIDLGVAAVIDKGAVEDDIDQRGRAAAARWPPTHAQAADIGRLIHYAAMTIRTNRTRLGAVAGLVAALAASGASAATAGRPPASPPVVRAEHPGHPVPPVGGLPARIDLPDGFRPEGITSIGTRVWVGSVIDGAIWSGDVRTGTGTVTTPGVQGRSLRGLLAVARSGVVWAAAGDGVDGVVLAVDARSGAIRHRIPIPGAVFLNDLTVTRDALWVTDSSVDRLARIPLDRRGGWTGAAPAFLPLGDPWPLTEGLRANGIRTLEDGSLILDHSTSGGLWRVDPATGAVAAIPVTGGAIVGGDGLVLVGRTLYVVRGAGRTEVTVVRLDGPKPGPRPGRKPGPRPTPSAQPWTATVTGALTGDVDVPSTATDAAGALYAVNARFGVTDPDAAEYWITRLSLSTP